MSGTPWVRDRTWNSGGRSLLTIFGLMGVFVLLPVQMVQLPFQMDLVDFWIVAVLGMFFLSFIAGHQTLKVSLSYLLAMWLILVASLASSFAAVDRSASLVVVLKEVYLIVMFVTMTALLSRLNARDFRLVLLVWLWTVVFHGMLIVTEFLRPDVFRFISGLAGPSTDYEIYRPSGLFFSPKAGNANKAAVFQLLGFVPLVLTSPSRRIALGLGLVLLSSILATGSMGTTIAFTAGLVVAVMALAVFGKHFVLITKLFVRSVIALTVVGGGLFFLIGESQGYQNHLERIILGRAEKSSAGRFTLWQRGIEALNEPQVLMWGVGPENFRDVDVLEKQLHNDLLAFAVERGLLGALGLVMLAGVAVVRSVALLKIGCNLGQSAGLSAVVFLSAFTAVLVVSLTHQVIHCREIWLVLAVQEAILWRCERDPAIAPQVNSLIPSRQCWGES